jgi:hypothetical protein
MLKINSNIVLFSRFVTIREDDVIDDVKSLFYIFPRIRTEFSVSNRDIRSDVAHLLYNPVNECRVVRKEHFR